MDVPDRRSASLVRGLSSLERNSSLATTPSRVLHATSPGLRGVSDFFISFLRHLANTLMFGRSLLNELETEHDYTLQVSESCSALIGLKCLA